MIITPTTLTQLFVGFNKSFQDGRGKAAPQWNKVATLVQSAGASTTYGWLGKWPKFREWVGDRVFNNLQAHAYSIVNKKFESSVEVERDQIEDDLIGAFAPIFLEMGQAAEEHPDELVFSLLKAGFATNCYDGQYFFDTDHPIYPNADGTGTAVTTSNMQAGTGDPWFLLDTSRSLKPIIYQERRKKEFKAMTKATDTVAAWMQDKYQYGIDGRCNVGYGFWQMAFGSKAALTEANVWAAHKAMTALKADGGRPLNVRPTLLVVPSSLEDVADSLINKQILTGGASNSMYKKYEVLVSPFLS
jgi:phage major head subunit gpT-like protein